MSKHSDKHADKKTNAMRELDRAGRSYQAHWFECPEALSGVEVAHLLKFSCTSALFIVSDISK